MALRRAQPDAAAPQIVDAARDAIAAMEAAGTAAVGDISNTLVTVPLLNAASLAAAVFFELLRFRGREAATVIEQAAERVRNATPAPHVRVWPAPHAPYSVSAPLFQALRRWLDSSPLARTSVHLAESVQETDLLASGKGPFRDLLEDLGAWDDEWTPPGCGPVEYLERLAFLRPRTLAVHGVQMDDVDLRRIARAGATLVTCPRSNRHVGVGDPPIGRFYESGVPIAIGTDSLASAPDLGVFGELAAMRALAPEVPAARLLESATLVGARALGCAQWLGSIEAGKSARLLAVTIPPGVGNVMEYLVSEVELAHVRWAPLPAERRDAGAVLVELDGMFARIHTWASFVRFSHSAFALPFALTGALLAARVAPVGWWQVAWIIVAMIERAQCGDGFQPARRRVVGRAESAHRRT